jgi:RNase P/RNase MRP subunit p29
MKYLLIVSMLATSVFAKGQKQETISSVVDKTKNQLVVEAACGQCQFALPGKSCDLAVRMNGKAYFVDGTHLDSHGDAHAKDGFCNATRKATVQGELVDDRFKATYFKLMPMEESKPKELKNN